MSLIQKLRDKSAILIFILIAIAILSFLLQDAFVGNTSQLFSNDSDRGAILKIDGKTISYEEFNRVLENTLENYKKQGIAIPETFRYNIIQNLWKQFIENKLVATDARKVGIKIAQKDVDDLFLGDNVPLFIKQQFTGGNPEKYNKDEVRSYLSQVQKLKDTDPAKVEFIQNLVNPLVEKLLLEKYLHLFSKAYYTPKWLMKKDTIDAHTLSNVRYVFVPYTAIKQHQITLNEQDYAEYFKKNQALYEVKKEKRFVDFVVFNAHPTRQDSLSLYASVEKLKPTFITTDDPKSFLIRHTSARSFEGAYSKEKELANLSHKNELLRLGAGQVFGPFLSEGAYQLVKLVKKKALPDSVICRHILVTTKDPRSGALLKSDSNAKVLIDSIRYLLSKGKKFEDLAAQYSDDEGSKNNGGVYSFAYENYNQLAKEFADAVFLGKKGDKKIIKTVFGYHYVEVLAQKNITPAYQFAFLTKKIQPGKQTRDSVLRVANGFLATLTTTDNFVESARKKGYETLMQQEFSASDYNVPRLGFVRNIVKWAFTASAKSLSEIYSIDNNYIIAGLTEILSKGKMDDKIKLTIAPKIMKEKIADRIIEKAGATPNLTALSSEYHTSILSLDNIKWNVPFIAGIGIDTKLLGGFFTESPTDKVIAIPGKMGVYFLIVTHIARPKITSEIYGYTPTRSDYQSVQSLMEALQKNYQFQDLSNNFY